MFTKTKTGNFSLVETTLITLSTAVIASILSTRYYSSLTKRNSKLIDNDRNHHDDDNDDTNDSEINIEKKIQQQEQQQQTQLGPKQSPETRYQLTLRGKVDKIFDDPVPVTDVQSKSQQQQQSPFLHRTKPFEFNSEVVQVFDDMVSRSVPLYCEVIDLAIYWFHLYHIPGSNVYDLGCSTGTTIDVLARSLLHSIMGENNIDHNCSTLDNETTCTFIGVDNSEAMVQACKEKLDWVMEKSSSELSTLSNIDSNSMKNKAKINVQIYCSNILGFDISNASMVIMNYTLQFIPVLKRQELLQTIYQGLINGGILFLSEKVRATCAEIQETCTYIYDDFKYRRNYTQREIARKKEALMNVLIPFTEGELRNALAYAGFENVEIVAKWNNFITFVARKKAPVLTCKDNMMDSKRKKKKKSSTINDMISTPNLDKLFDGSPPIYLNILDHLDAPSLQSICLKRLEAISNKGGLSKGTLQDYDEIASMILKLPQIVSKKILVNTNELTIGSDDELSPDQLNLFNEIIHKLKPWKKGPLNLFGTKIDTEWRSDWKFERLQKSNKFETLLNDKVICDLGCGNGYYMYRMLEYNPKMVIGIDPNLHAFLEFQLFQRFTKSEDNVGKLQFEFLRGDAMKLFPTTFDVVFCLGVLYHTNDPVGMLRDIYSSMNGGGCLIVDCQGIPGDEPIALFPQKRYANMTGVYFLPTVKTLEYWLARANFKNFEVLFAEPLSTDEQRITEWAPVKTSLKESLDMNDMSLTREGYPAPHRFYVKVHK